jgi:hypothetical protein
MHTMRGKLRSLDEWAVSEDDMLHDAIERG